MAAPEDQVGIIVRSVTIYATEDGTEGREALAYLQKSTQELKILFLDSSAAWLATVSDAKSSLLQEKDVRWSLRDNSLILTRVLDTELQLRVKLDHLPMKQIPFESTAITSFRTVVDHMQDLEAQLHDNVDLRKYLEKERNKLVLQLKKCAEEKIAMEEELMSRFQHLLNSKKKIPQHADEDSYGGETESESESENVHGPVKSSMEKSSALDSELFADL